MTPVIRPGGQYRFADADLARGAGNTSIRSPLRSILDYQDAIGKTAQDAGDQISKKINAVVEFIKDTTGIDLTGPAALLSVISSAIGIGPLQDILPKILAGFGGIDLNAPNPIIKWITDHVPLASEFAEAITGIVDGDLNSIARFFDSLRAFMHFDLLDDAFDPIAAALDFVGQVLKPVGVLDGTSPLAARNLFGDLAARLFRLVPVSSIGDTNPNLLDDPQFQNGDGFDGTEGVDHDPTVGKNSLGSVRFTADGTDNQILSDPSIPVTAGQKLSLSISARWVGLTGAGTTVTLGITAFNAAGAVVEEPVISGIAAAGTSAAGAWTVIGGTYTVPATVTSVRVRLGITANATAGQVWMDDASATKTQKLPQSFTVDLVDDLDDVFSGLASSAANLTSLGDKVGAGFKAFYNKWLNRSDGTGTVDEVEQVVESIRDAVLNGYNVHTVTANETNWPVPSHTEAIIIAIGGGQPGLGGTNGGSAVGRAGGLSGSYIAQPVNLTGITNLDTQIGTQGNKSFVRVANSTPHTGALVLASPDHGAIGSIAGPLGYTPTSSTPGKGGNGGGMGTGRDLPQAGESSALGAGGAPGGNNGTWGTPGQPGGSVSAGSATKCGGGGGGGGGAAVQTLNVGGNGGDGGYPGGGGGAGGNCSGTPNQVGSGGAGAIGVVFILTR